MQRKGVASDGGVAWEGARKARIRAGAMWFLRFGRLVTVVSIPVDKLRVIGFRVRSAVEGPFPHPQIATAPLGDSSGASQ